MFAWKKRINRETAPSTANGEAGRSNLGRYLISCLVASPSSTLSASQNRTVGAASRSPEAHVEHLSGGGLWRLQMLDGL